LVVSTHPKNLLSPLGIIISNQIGFGCDTVYPLVIKHGNGKSPIYRWFTHIFPLKCPFSWGFPTTFAYQKAIIIVLPIRFHFFYHALHFSKFSLARFPGAGVPARYPAQVWRPKNCWDHSRFLADGCAKRHGHFVSSWLLRDLTFMPKCFKCFHQCDLGLEGTLGHYTISGAAGLHPVVPITLSLSGAGFLVKVGSCKLSNSGTHEFLSFPRLVHKYTVGNFPVT
jgi:hypothetical protein